MYVCMYVCMDVWMYGCMDVWMYGCMDVWMYGCMDVWMYGCMYACMHVCMYIYIHTKYALYTTGVEFWLTGSSYFPSLSFLVMCVPLTPISVLSLRALCCCWILHSPSCGSADVLGQASRQLNVFTVLSRMRKRGCVCWPVRQSASCLRLICL